MYITSAGALLFPEDQSAASPSATMAKVGAQAAVRLTCPHLMGPDQMPMLASGTPWPLSCVPVDESRQEGMAVLDELNNLSACLEGGGKKKFFGN